MKTTNLIAMLMTATLALSSPASAQQPTGDVWRTFAQKLDAGSEVTVRLENGQRFHATLIDARPDALVLQPRTRRPVPVQPVAYDAIRSIERYDRRGTGTAKAIGIGVAAGAGTFLAILAILFAGIDD
jgi:hypothetical protein